MTKKLKLVTSRPRTGKGTKSEEKYISKLTEEEFIQFLADFGDDHSEVFTVAEEDNFGCIEARLKVGEVRYFLQYESYDSYEIVFFELNFPTFYSLVSIHSRATSLQRVCSNLPEQSEPFYEKLINDYYTRCMMVIGKCETCKAHFGGYKQGHLNKCPLRWSGD